MLIVSTAIDFNADQVRPFMTSLLDTGYDGDIIFLVNECPAKYYLKSMNVEVVDNQSQGYPLNSDRFFMYKEFVRGVDDSLIVDSRDLVFQSDPSLHMPLKGIHAFEEDRSQTLGTCPYNNLWLTQMLGTNPYPEKPILCAGTICGQLSEYIIDLWEHIKSTNPLIGFDQGIHNHLCYSGKYDVTIHENGMPVYTVGYTHSDNIDLVEGIIYKDGDLPCIIHQYDRHPKLKGLKWL